MNKIYNKKAFTLIELLIVIVIIIIIASCMKPNVHPTRASTREKNCFSNLRVITGAVEMYNLDNPPKNQMRSLELQTLVNGHYLKSIPTGPDVSCKYFSDGDLSVASEGIIACKYHGDREQKRFKTKRIY